MELEKVNLFLERVVDELTEVSTSDVAKTILAQMGGQRKLIVMTGAYDFFYNNKGANGQSLRFKFKNPKGPNFVEITLNLDDTYDIEFGNIKAGKYKIIKEYSGVYADNLIDLFEKTTGLYLSL